MAPLPVPEIDTQSRDILGLRPNIQFVAPDVLAGIPEAIDAVFTVAALTNMRKARILADNVNKLAKAAQIRVDTRADFTAALDPIADAPVIMAMRRKYPLDDPTKIRYDQYKICKANVATRGEELADNVRVTPDKVEAAADQPVESAAFANDPRSKLGLNRPETTSQSQIVEPLDLIALQEKLLKALANMIWKTAIKPVIVEGAPPVSGIFEALPDLIFPEEEIPIGDFLKPDEGNKNIKYSPNRARKLPQGKTPETEEQAVPQEGKNPLVFSDCMLIAKTYEKAALFSTTEGSVFAMLTPHLQTIIAQTGAATKQIDSAEAVTNLKGTAEKIQNEVSASQGDSSALQSADAPPPTGVLSTAVPEGETPPTEDDEPLFTDFVPVNAEGERQWDRIFDSKCIPCGFRLSLDTQALDKFANLGDPLWNSMIGWFEQMKKYIDDILDFFDSLGEGNDLCMFVQFFCDYVCVPDIMKILSLLSALLLKLAFEQTSMFDLIMGLIGPLVQPILSSLLSTLHQAIMMIVDPIKCIIDAIVAVMRKLDYNSIFQNAGTFKSKFSAGPLQGGTEVPNENRPTIPYSDIKVGPETVRTGTNKRAVDLEFNPLAKLDGQTDETNALEKAQQELDAVQQAGAGVDASDPEAVEQHEENLTAAQDKVNSAANDDKNSKIGQAANAVESLKPMLNQLVGYLEEIMSAVAAFESKLFDELQKLMGQYLGGTGSAIHTNFKKLGIIQMIGVVTGLLKLLQEVPSCSCNDPVAIEAVVGQMTNETSLTFWTDDDGVVHIEEDSDSVDDATDDIIAILGGTQDKTVLKSTGDPLLDTEIAKTVEALTKPVEIIVRCQKQTSVADAEQVNKWMSELDQE